MFTFLMSCGDLLFFASPCIHLIWPWYCQGVMRSIIGIMGDTILSRYGETIYIHAVSTFATGTYIHSYFLNHLHFKMCTIVRPQGAVWFDTKYFFLRRECPRGIFTLVTTLNPFPHSNCWIRHHSTVSFNSMGHFHQELVPYDLLLVVLLHDQ